MARWTLPTGPGIHPRVRPALCRGRDPPLFRGFALVRFPAYCSSRRPDLHSLRIGRPGPAFAGGLLDGPVRPTQRTVRFPKEGGHDRSCRIGPDVPEPFALGRANPPGSAIRQAERLPRCHSCRAVSPRLGAPGNDSSVPSGPEPHRSPPALGGLSLLPGWGPGGATSAAGAPLRAGLRPCTGRFPSCGPPFALGRASPRQGRAPARPPRQWSRRPGGRRASR
jgi:hypothetical protein